MINVSKVDLSFIAIGLILLHYQELHGRKVRTWPMETEVGASVTIMDESYAC